MTIEFNTNTGLKNTEILESSKFNECLDVKKSEIVKNISNDSDQKIIHYIIKQHINSICKKFCFDNRFQYICTLDDRWSKSPSDAVLCDLGNGTYDWMLVELNHLRSNNEKNNIKIDFLEGYYRKVVSSLIFFERYKNWRFQRRIRVPDYIKVLDKDACKIFWGLHDQDSIENLAQRLKRKKSEIKYLISSIYHELHKRKRTYILTQNIELSMDDEFTFSEFQADNVYSSFVEQNSVEKNSLHVDVMTAYKKLNWKEQYILDTMVIDELSAAAVLKTLREQCISLDDKINPKELNIQHVYYFLRKTIVRLKKISKIEEVELI